MGFIFKIFFSSKSSIPIEVKQFPDFRQLADHPVPEGSTEAQSDWPGESSSQSGSVDKVKVEEMDTQVLTPDAHHDHHISPPLSYYCSTLSTSYTHTSLWEKVRMAQTHLDTKTRTMFSTKSKKKKIYIYISLPITTA